MILLYESINLSPNNSEPFQERPEEVFSIANIGYGEAFAIYIYKKADTVKGGLKA